MANPLRTEELVPPVNPPRPGSLQVHPGNGQGRSGSLQFTHFGVLNDGAQNKASFITSTVINVIIAAIAILLSVAAVKIEEKQPKTVTLVDPTLIQPIKPPPPVLRPPRIVPPRPTPPKLVEEPPKIKLPEVKTPTPEPPKVVAVHKMPTPTPAIAPAPPKAVVAPPAPAPVSLAHPMAAAVPNNSPHPAPVAMGRPDNPIAPSNRPATSAINLGQRGLSGMPASNTGAGPAATTVRLGSGSPGGTSMSGNGTQSARGVSLGVPGGTGTGPGSGAGRPAGGPVNLGQATTPAAPRPQQLASATAQSAPKVIYKPRPEYTPEARSLHLEGTVSVRLRVAASGAVQVLGIVNGLGHGLDQAAERAVQATRFQPAKDASGNPVDWTGVVNVAFQLAE